MRAADYERNRRLNIFANAAPTAAEEWVLHSTRYAIAEAADDVLSAYLRRIRVNPNPFPSMRLWRWGR